MFVYSHGARVFWVLSKSLTFNATLNLQCCVWFSDAQMPTSFTLTELVTRRIRTQVMLTPVIDISPWKLWGWVTAKQGAKSTTIVISPLLCQPKLIRSTLNPANCVISRETFEWIVFRTFMTNLKVIKSVCMSYTFLVPDQSTGQTNFADPRYFLITSN